VRCVYTAAGKMVGTTEPPLKRAKTDEVKGAIVTGAASGIGLATAKLLAAKGCRVIFADRDEEKGKKEAAAVGQIYKYVDVSDEASIQKLAAFAKEALPNVSLLVNCAGCDFYTEFGEKFSSALFDRTIQVNLRSVFLMCRDLLPLLKESRGSIVNISSIQAHRCFPDFSSYASTKGAIISMSRQLAGDLARYGIRVNSISPGAVRTALGPNSCKHESQAGDPADEGGMPVGEPDELLSVLEPEDVADSIVSMLFMRGVTGQDLIVDGGCSIIGVPWWRPFPTGAEHPHVQKAKA